PISDHRAAVRDPNGRCRGGSGGSVPVRAALPGARQHRRAADRPAGAGRRRTGTRTALGVHGTSERTADYGGRRLRRLSGHAGRESARRGRAGAGPPLWGRPAKGRAAAVPTAAAGDRGDPPRRLRAAGRADAAAAWAVRRAAAAGSAGTGAGTRPGAGIPGAASALLRGDGRPAAASALTPVTMAPAREAAWQSLTS